MHYNRCTYIKQQQLSADNALTAETTRGSLSVAPSKFLLIEVLNISLKKVKSISIKYYTPILTYKHTQSQIYGTYTILHVLMFNKFKIRSSICPIKNGKILSAS